ESRSMKVRKLMLNEFRGIARMELEFHERVNVLVGKNGAGKSAILDCLAILLSRLIGRIRSTTGTGRFFGDYDITNGQKETENEISVEIDGQSASWAVTKTRRGLKKQTITNLKQLKEIVQEIHTAYESDEDLDFPLAVYYPVNRAVLDIPLRIRRRHEFDQLSAYDQALTGASDNFRIFFEWYRNREDLENETRIRKPRHRDRELRAVRTAIENLLPGCSGLHVQRGPLRMVVNKGETELVVDQLSDGEKCQLALAGDLARRLAIANPSLTNARHGQAVVLIDEVDLHLHPSWQRRIVPDLAETFPNCQFIVTTHSPQIVSEVREGNVVLLKRCGDNVSVCRPETSYGQATNRILEDLMGTAERPEAVKDAFAELFRAIEEDRLKEAETAAKKLGDLVGPDPQLTRARTMIRRKEILGK
ncbi:MAG: AAA family ATPase, partial [Planctomycetota bacterium]